MISLCCTHRTRRAMSSGGSEACEAWRVTGRVAGVWREEGAVEGIVAHVSCPCLCFVWVACLELARER
jgi:hypothetical protein